MLYVFIASSIVLVGLFALAWREASHGYLFGELFRTEADRRILSSISAFERTLRQSYEHICRDVLLRTIHMVTYTALVTVRKTETWLERVMMRIRGSRMKRRKVASEYLRRILGEDRTE